MNSVDFVDLGTISFEDACELQAQAVRRIAKSESSETVHLLEHHHVFTIGRRGLADNLVSSVDFDGNSLSVVRINRGGDVTYHGPGQLVVYPHLDLRLRGRDLGRYLRNLEECVIRSSRHFGVDGYQRKKLTGVWTDRGKLASIGVGVRRWITMHGLALNVSTDLSYFKLINPCGIPECPITSLEEILGRLIDLAEVKEEMKRNFLEIFGL